MNRPRYPRHQLSDHLVPALIVLIGLVILVQIIGHMNHIDTLALQGWR